MQIALCYLRQVNDLLSYWENESLWILQKIVNKFNITYSYTYENDY